MNRRVALPAPRLFANGATPEAQPCRITVLESVALRPGAELPAVQSALRAAVPLLAGTGGVLDLRVRGCRRQGVGPVLETALVVRSADDKRHGFLVETLESNLTAAWGSLRHGSPDDWLRPLGTVRSCAWLTRREAPVALQGGTAWTRIPLGGAGEDRTSVWDALVRGKLPTVLSIAVRAVPVPAGVAAEVEAEMERLRALGRDAVRSHDWLGAQGAVVRGDDGATHAANQLAEWATTLGDPLVLTRTLVASELGDCVVPEELAHATGAAVHRHADPELAAACLGEVDTVHPQGIVRGSLPGLLFALSPPEVDAVLRPPVHATRAVPGTATLRTTVLPASLAQGAAHDAEEELDETWMQSLPDPLVAPLVRYERVGDVQAQADALRRFFENVAIWRFAVLAAPYGTDELGDIPAYAFGKVGSLAKPTYATWTVLGDELAARWRRALDVGDRAAVLDAFRTADARHLDALLHPEVAAVLPEAGEARNSSAHHQVQTLTRLRYLFERLRAAWADGLCSPGVHVVHAHEDVGVGSVAHHGLELRDLRRRRKSRVVLRSRIPTGRVFLHEPGQADGLPLAPVVRFDDERDATTVLCEAGGGVLRYCLSNGDMLDATIPVADELAVDWLRSVGRARAR